MNVKPIYTLVTKMRSALTLSGVTTALAKMDSAEMDISVMVSMLTTNIFIDSGIKFQ